MGVARLKVVPDVLCITSATIEGLIGTHKGGLTSRTIFDVIAVQIWTKPSQMIFSNCETIMFESGPKIQPSEK